MLHASTLTSVIILMLMMRPPTPPKWLMLLLPGDTWQCLHVPSRLHTSPQSSQHCPWCWCLPPLGKDTWQFLHVPCWLPTSELSTHYCLYRVSSKTVYTVILLFSRVPYHIQKNFWPFFNSPGDEDFKTHLTLLPRWKIDQVTAQNIRQTWFWKYHFDGRFCFFIEGVANFRVNYLSHF